MGLARRADAALRAASGRRAARASAAPAARPARTPAALLRRLESPERLVPVLVAGFLLIASVTAVPGLAGGPTGATEGAGATPRLVVGGDVGLYADSGVLGPNDGAGTDPGLGFDETPAGVALGQASTEGAPEVAGQFLADGTLLKPVVVDTTVEDGRSQLRTYKVRPGDTLTGIASRTGVSMMTIWWANKLKSKDDLKIGQVLVVPPVNGLVVTVKAGDTLATVAAAEKADAADIVEANALTDETLVIGQVLIVPGARGAPIPTPKPTRRPVVRVATVSRTTGTSRTSTRPPAQYSGGAFAWPVAGGYISQYFHYGHAALDIAADYGTPVRAAAAGTVVFAGWKGNGGGYQVWIAHGSGLSTTYNHMSAIAVSYGEGVGRGAFIGRIGTSGWSTGPHLHFEVWHGDIWGGGYRVNPLSYL
ncbi:MAG TPA: M23 family metallopeptidase [Candidatus Nanopelagicales bacterium]|nr:M23 family metallopeptidase [Candidatus Nanopelagicales bacterium]